MVVNESSGRGGETSTVAENDDDFPTAELLRRANDDYYSQNSARNRNRLDEHGLPVPLPARRKKEEVFKIDDYVALDRKACEAPNNLLDGTIDELVDYLVHGTRTELQKVRVIFRWITAQNPALEKQRHVGAVAFNPSTPREHLIAIERETGTYHSLVSAMCSCVDINTQLVRGFTKHSKYEPGDELPSDSNGSGSWTAVLIDTEWHLMDVHWASKQVAGEVNRGWELIDDNGQGRPRQPEAKTRQVLYEYDETYFLTSAEEFIYTHFPVDQKWQLLARPVSAEEFVKMAYVKGDFFRYGLRMNSHKLCVVKSMDGEITLTIDQPLVAKYSFLYKLWQSNKGTDKSDSHKDTDLKRFAVMQNKQGMLHCNVKFPTPGKFKLEIFCLDNSKAEHTYSFACAHVISVDKPKENIVPYPENSRCVWGPGYDLEQVGMQPLTHPEGLVNVDKGETEMKFSTSKDIDFMAQLHSNNMSKQEMAKFVIYRIEKDQVIINVKFPEPGDYALNMFAREKKPDDSGKELMTNVCSYLLSAPEAAADLTPFAASGRLGARDMMEKLGISPVSHPSGYVQSITEGHAEFVFNSPPDRQFSTEMVYCNGDETEKVDEFTIIERTISTVTIRTRFPKKGQYKMNLFGKDSKAEGSSLPLLFSYLIVVQQPMEPCLPFPKVYSGWTADCQMIKPDLGSALYAERTIPVAVRIPSAHGVAFIATGNRWTELIQDDNDVGVWRGELFTGPVDGEIKLSACFDEASNSYSTLLIFKVMSPPPADVEEFDQYDGETVTEVIQTTTITTFDDDDNNNSTAVTSVETVVVRTKKPTKPRKKKLPAVSSRPVNRKKKDVNNQPELVEQWKASFLADEHRKTLGEKEYRRRWTMGRKEKLAELAQLTATLR